MRSEMFYRSRQIFLQQDLLLLYHLHCRTTSQICCHQMHFTTRKCTKMRLRMGVRAPGELTAMDLREPFATGGKGKEQGRRQAKGRDMKAGLKKGAGWEWEG